MMPSINTFTPTMIITAGAYVRSGNAFVFAIGPTPDHTALAVFRLGGHREPDENAWQCAAREATEEASIMLHALLPPATYWSEASAPETSLSVIGPPTALVDPIAPFLIVSAQATDHQRLSVMYLAETSDQPVPAAEIAGLLFLKPHEIQRIVKQPTTLQHYVESGGQAILRTALDSTLVLRPLTQLRVLAELLQRHPELVRSIP
jgi:8-oxo-dGTP pyrophosphatase MutT (NUDIX family)